MSRPRLPQSGDVLTARTMRWIIQRVAAFVRGGPGIRIATGPGGEITIVNTRKGGAQKTKKHPWQVTPNGDDTVTIEPGKIKGWNMVLAANPGFTRVPFTYAGDSTFMVTVTGWLYAQMGYTRTVSENSASGTVSHDAINIAIGGAITIVNESIAPGLWAPAGNIIAIPIAEVDLTDGVVTVIEQIENEHVEFAAMTAEISTI